MQLILRDGEQEVAVELEVSTAPAELLRRLRLRGRGGCPQREAAFQLAQDLRTRVQDSSVITRLAEAMVLKVDTASD